MRKEIEEQIKDLKETTGLRNSLTKLYKNKDFLKVISTGYFEKEPVRLTMLRPDVPGEHKVEVDEQLTSIGLLYKYFEAVVFNGNQADMEIEKLEEELLNLGEEI